jgi:hypothetical protein
VPSNALVEVVEQVLNSTYTEVLEQLLKTLRRCWRAARSGLKSNKGRLETLGETKEIRKSVREDNDLVRR